MKKIFNVFAIAAIATTSFVGCSDDDFTESIYDTNISAVDDSKTTAKFDNWIYENFTKPYNVDILYRFSLPASDMDFRLTPAEYKRSQLLSHFIKYLFYDVYTKYGGDDFMKKSSLRLFHFIGSSGYSPTTGTEILGLASGGVKITLYMVNEMKPYEPGVIYDAADMELLNEKYFHTMHHEFSHILHQTKSYPVTFGQVTSGSYDPMNWQDRDSTLSHSLGYVTQYASSANYEDFVETLSCTITDTDSRWMARIINGCLAGVRAGDKESILDLIVSEDKLAIPVSVLDDPNARWNKFTIYAESEYDAIEGKYVPTDRKVQGEHRNLTSEVVNKEHTAYVKQFKYDEVARMSSFRDFLANYVEIVNNDDVAGMNAILKKIDIANTWYKEKWGLDAFVIRKEVQKRQDEINEYLKTVTIYDYE